MKRLYIVLIGLLLLPFASAQEEPQQEEQTVNQMPQWVLDFSNLSRETREAYQISFNKAKIAYQRGEWIACFSHLADCEMIFNSNPNVWNLYVSCLIEQKHFADAEQQLRKVLIVIPNDPVAQMNLANLYLGTGRYTECIEAIDNMLLNLSIHKDIELINVLNYRKVLALIKQGKPQDAKKLVAHLNAFSDTPLYYYSQAAFYLAQNKKTEASRSLRSANNIFSKSAMLIPYQRALNVSGLIEAASSR